MTPSTPDRAVTPVSFFPTRRTLLATGLAIAIVLLAQGARVLLRQRDRQLALAEATARLEKQLAGQRRKTAAIQHELDLAAAQLAELPAPAPADEIASDRARSAEMTAWLDRFRQLRQRFEQEPGQRIPEMRLLGDEDWLLAIKTNPLNTAETLRKARAAVREAGKHRFCELLQRALANYRKTVGEAPPAAISVLSGFFEPPVDPDILQRYKVWNPPAYEGPSRARRAAASLRAWEIREREPIDADYDTCLTATATGAIVHQSWSNAGLRPDH